VVADIEVADKLEKEINISGLINGLLIKHYDNTKLLSLPLEELKRLRAIDNQIKALSEELRIATNG